MDLPNSGWRTSKVVFSNLNLIVGISGSGKTRLLNTISNIRLLTRGKLQKTGCWEVSFEVGPLVYDWNVNIIPTKDGPLIDKEILSVVENGEKRNLVIRDRENFIFESKTLPKISKDETSISLLKDEDSIKPLYDSFDLFLRREYSIDSLKEAAQKHLFNFDKKRQVEAGKDLRGLLNFEGLNDRLDATMMSFPEIFKDICNYFMEVFPFVKRTEIKKQESPFGLVPIFCIKEKNVDKWIPLSELSSGMQKVLFMITDICSLPNDSIYFIDEYENSLGLNAIDFLPDLLFETKNKIQFFITSHHPYLINNIPVTNWYVCHRTGQYIDIKYGKDLEERFGKSKQKAFINLINDPIYSKGIE
jgi:energy-coupling factor transporter ATP-binding protein EcfA2